MSDTPRTQREFLDAVVDELNLDTTDVLTKVLANVFALADQRDMLKRENAALRRKLAEAQRTANFWLTEFERLEKAFDTSEDRAEATEAAERSERK